MPNTETCQECGRPLPAGARFCPHCATPVANAAMRCGHCGKDAPANSEYCPHCGEPLATTQRPRIQDNHWARGVDEFAARIDVHDVPGLFAKSLVVEPGCRALVLEDGRVPRGELGPGRYTLQNFLGALRLPGAPRQLTAVVVDAADVDLDFELANLYTRDPIPVELSCTVTIGLIDALAFLEQVLKGRRRLTLSQLRTLVFDEVSEAARVVIGRHSIAELSGASATPDAVQQVRTALESAMADLISPTLTRRGLAFVHLRTARYRSAAVEGVQALQSEYWLLTTTEEAKLGGRQRLADVLSAQALEDVAAEMRQAATYQARAQVWAQLRQVLLSDRADELHTADALAQVVAEVDRSQLLRTDEIETLRAALAAGRDDWQAARAHALALVDLQRQRELRLGQIALHGDLTQAELLRQQENEQLRVEALLASETRRWQADLQRRDAEADWQRRDQAADAAAQRARALADAVQDLDLRKRQAQTQADIDAIEREQDRLDTELATATLERMQAIKLKKQAEQQRLEWQRKTDDARLAAEQARAALELRLVEESARHQRELATAEAARAHELRRLEVMAGLGIDALIASSGSEQAQLLKELGATRAMQGWTPEQILAQAAAHSPDVAKAFQEKFRAAGQGGEGGSRIDDMYHQLLAQQAAASRTLSEAQERSAQRMQEMFDKAMDTALGTAQATAGVTPVSEPATTSPWMAAPLPPPSPPPRVRASGPSHHASRSTAHDGTGPADDQDDTDGEPCPRCQAPTLPGTQFCHNCGEEL